MANMHEIINDICYIISVIALLGILLFIILEDFNYFSGDTPAWKLQIFGSTIGAIITAVATIGAIFIKDWWENKIKIKVDLYECGEENADGDIDAYTAISARNYSKMSDVALGPPLLEYYRDGELDKTFGLTEVKRENLDYYTGLTYYKDARGHIIEFPYNLKPGMGLFILMDDPNRIRQRLIYQDIETGEYDFPETEGYLIARFSDQLKNSFVSPPYYIF